MANFTNSGTNAAMLPILGNYQQGNDQAMMPIPRSYASRQLTQQNVIIVDLSEPQEVRLEKAVEAVRLQQISGYAAAQRFQVPKSTIFARLKHSGSEEDSRGHPKLTQRQSESLAFFLDVRAKLFNPVVRSELIDIASDLAKENKSIDAADKLSESWLKAFRKKYPNCAIRRSNHDKSEFRLPTLSWSYLKDIFCELGHMIRTNQYRPCDLHIVDDQSFQLFGSRNAPPSQQHQMMFESHFSLINHASADGWYVPPRIAWPATFVQNLNVNELPPGSQVTTNMNGDISDAMLTSFICDLIDSRQKRSADVGEQPRRQLLIFESTGAQLSYKAITLLRENNWDMVQLPPNLLSILYPSFVNIHCELFREFENEKSRVLSALPQNAVADPRSNNVINWARVFTVAWNKCMNLPMISSTFQFFSPWESDEYNLKLLLFKLQQIGRQGSVIGSPFIPSSFFSENVHASVIPAPLLRQFPYQALPISPGNLSAFNGGGSARKKRGRKQGDGGDATASTEITEPSTSKRRTNAKSAAAANSQATDFLRNVSGNVDLSKLWNPYNAPMSMANPNGMQNMMPNFNPATFISNAAPVDPNSTVNPEEAKDNMIAYLVKLVQMQQSQLQQIQVPEESATKNN